MFSDAKLPELDLSSFDLSRVTNHYYMFSFSSIKTGYTRTEEDARMFNGSGSLPSKLKFVIKE